MRFAKILFALIIGNTFLCCFDPADVSAQLFLRRLCNPCLRHAPSCCGPVCIPDDPTGCGTCQWTYDSGTQTWYVSDPCDSADCFCKRSTYGYRDDKAPICLLIPEDRDMAIVPPDFREVFLVLMDKKPEESKQVAFVAYGFPNTSSFHITNYSEKSPKLSDPKVKPNWRIYAIYEGSSEAVDFSISGSNPKSKHGQISIGTNKKDMEDYWFEKGNPRIIEWGKWSITVTRLKE